MCVWAFSASALSASALSGCGEREFIASLPLAQQGDGDGDGVGGGGGASTGGVGGDQSGTGGVREPWPTLRVEGQVLRGRCDEPVVLRGVNEMVIWSNEVDGQPWFDEMAALGANAVRIVWSPEGTAEELDRVVGNAIGAGLIAVIELHEPIFDGAELEPDDPTLADRVVGYWTSEQILPVLIKYEHASLLEFGEKMGDSFDVDFWVSRFQDMMVRFRDAGIRAPLVFDAPYGGVDLDGFLEGAPQVLAVDKWHNSMFSLEAWSATTPENVARIQATYDAGIPIYLAEFSGWQSGDDCPSVATDVPVLLAKLQELGLGWFAWSWGGVPNDSCGSDGALDMTTNGHVGGLVDWGWEVAINDANSIANTAVKLESLQAPSCSF